MKKYLTALLALLAVPVLMATAYADVIAGPMLPVFYIMRALPWILVGAVVGVTIYLLQKFWKKRK